MLTQVAANLQCDEVDLYGLIEIILLSKNMPFIETFVPTSINKSSLQRVTAIRLPRSIAPQHEIHLYWEKQPRWAVLFAIELFELSG